MNKIRLYARLVIEGALALDEIPLEFRVAVENEIEKIHKSNT